jgi:hypothetical protein
LLPGREAKDQPSHCSPKAGAPTALYRYQSRPEVSAGEYQSKFFLVWDGLVHGNQGGSIVRVMLPDAPGAEAEAVNFADNLIPQMRRSLGAQEQ